MITFEFKPNEDTGASEEQCDKLIDIIMDATELIYGESKYKDTYGEPYRAHLHKQPLYAKQGFCKYFSKLFEEIVMDIRDLSKEHVDYKL